MLYGDTGRLLVRALFWEMSTTSRRKSIPPLYTLKVQSAHGLPSMYSIYMDSVDEYDAAMKVVGTMKAWRSLCEARWFRIGCKEHGHEGLIQWRKDMEARDKSTAKKQLQEKADAGNVAAMTKIYNMNPKGLDKRLKKKLPDITPSKVSDITARMEGK